MKEDSIAHLVDSLSGGLIDNDRRRAYSSYNTLFRIGAEAIPFLEERLLSQSWAHLRYPYLSRYAVGIIALIRDIDEKRADAAIDRLIHKGCDEGLKKAIHSVQGFSTSSFVRYRLFEVDILEEKGLTTTISIRSLLEVWLANVPRKDLDHLVRILVVHSKRLHESAGNYTPFLAKIELAWPALLKKRSVFSSLVSLYAEHVLYHEIGHHVRRHNFGQVPEQELQADHYAFRIMRQSHPRLTWFFRKRHA